MEAEDEDKPKAHLLIRLLGLAWMALALALVLTFWQAPFLFTLASAFRVHLTLAVLALGLPLTFLYPHRNRWVFLGLPLAVSLTFISYLLPRTPMLDAAHSGSVKIVLANLYSGNHDMTRLSRWVAEERPDILTLVEVSPAQIAQLEALPFAYKSLHPQNSNFGVGLLAQKAPDKVEVLDEKTPFPSLLATWPEYRLLLTHPIPPINIGAREYGDAQMERLLQDLRKASPLPLLVVGDLNATGWDRRLEPLKRAGMQEARAGHGLLPTWPVGQPVLRIPIDHIFLPPGWETRACRRGPEIGSDHFPLLAEVVYPIAPTAR